MSTPRNHELLVNLQYKVNATIFQGYNAMTLTVEINNLRLQAHHGVMPQEQKIGNTFEVTVHLSYTPTQPISDDLSGTINYADVVDIIKHEMAITSQLLEHVAWRIYKHLTTDYPQITGGTVSVAKLTPPITAQMQSAAVRISW